MIYNATVFLVFCGAKATTTSSGCYCILSKRRSCEHEKRRTHVKETSLNHTYKHRFPGCRPTRTKSEEREIETVIVLRKPFLFAFHTSIVIMHASRSHFCRGYHQNEGKKTKIHRVFSLPGSEKKRVKGCTLSRSFFSKGLTNPENKPFLSRISRGPRVYRKTSIYELGGGAV